MKIADSLYFYPWESYTQNNCNSILLTGPVNVLIDPGHQGPFPRLASQIKNDGVNVESLDLVINTHCHPDHFEASTHLAGHGIKIALHPQDEEYMNKIGPMLFRAMGANMPALNVDLYLAEGELELGDKHFRVYHTPGHSPGSVCLYWPQHKVLISGDLIFDQGVGRTDFPGGDGRALKQSIERMAELDIDILLPGHGPAVIGRDNIAKNFEFIRYVFFPMFE